MNRGRLLTWIALAAVIASLALHLPFLNHPPYSQHVWRQSATMMVAENLYEEGMDIFHPRVNQRMDGNGITGMHFPLYEYVLALAYQVFGKQFWLPRIWSWVLSVLGAWAIARITLRWWKSQKAATLAFVFYLFSPEIFYNGWIALPDVLALPLCLWGLVMYYRYRDRNDFLSLGFATLLFMLGGLVKLQYLGIGLFIAGEVWMDRKSLSLRDWLAHAVFGILSVLPVLAWYRYAREQIERSKLADFGIELKPAESLEQALYVLKKNLISDLPETLLGFVAVIGLATMIFFLFRDWKTVRSNRVLIPMLFFASGFLVYHLLELRVLEHHQYYMLPYLTMLVPLCARGLERLTKGNLKILVPLLGIQIALTAFRMIPARFANPDRQIPEAFWKEETRTRLQQAVPDTARIITGPDQTMCMYLYFLHKKGWNFERPGDLLKVQANGRSDLDWAVQSGCRYLITSQENIEQTAVATYLEARINYIDGFSVYLIRDPEE